MQRKRIGCERRGRLLVLVFIDIGMHGFCCFYNIENAFGVFQITSMKQHHVRWEAKFRTETDQVSIVSNWKACIWIVIIWNNRQSNAEVRRQVSTTASNDSSLPARSDSSLSYFSDVSVWLLTAELLTIQVCVFLDSSCRQSWSCQLWRLLNRVPKKSWWQCSRLRWCTCWWYRSLPCRPKNPHA